MSANVYREQLVEPGDRVISALDNMTWDEAIAQVDEMGQHIGMGKTNSLHQRLGADLIVVGRGINKASDYDMTKAEAAEAIAEDVKEALAS